jgi:hypothetical protein
MSWQGNSSHCLKQAAPVDAAAADTLVAPLA